MVNKLLSGFLLVLVLVGLAGAVPPAPTGGHVVAPSTPSFTLSVTKAGTGAGTVTGPGVNCGSDCSESYVANTSTFLFASPEVGSTFTGWSGACTGTGSCNVTVSAASSVTATFMLTVVTADVYASSTGTGSPNTCTSYFSPCHVVRLLQVITCGQTGMLRDGIYLGTNYMLSIPDVSCSAGHEITIIAENDGQVTIDGEYARAPLIVNGTASYWTFQGFDVANSTGPTIPWGSCPNDACGGNSVVEMAGPGFPMHTNLTFKRIVAYNAGPYLPNGNASYANSHVWAVNYTINSTFEDIAGFGTGRNTLIEFGNEFPSPTSTGNTYRRVWLMWEGMPYPSDRIGCAGGVIQSGYHTDGRSLFEDTIAVYDGQQAVVGGDPPNGWGRCYTGAGNAPLHFGFSVIEGSNNRDPSITSSPGNGTGDRYYGRVIYAPGSHLGLKQPLNYDWLRMKTTPDVNNNPSIYYEIWRDVFVDGRNQPVPPVNTGCDSSQSDCLNRITALRDPTAPSASPPYVFSADTSVVNSGSFTNFNECTTLASCPDFYTGTLGGTLGARNCFEYNNGTLSSTPKWPWRMDDRIKAARARAFGQGRGGSALAGVSGSGGTSTWAANTVTSEIVSRYGAIPSACVR